MKLPKIKIPETVKVALRNGFIVGGYTLFSAWLVTGTITLNMFMTSVATAGLVFFTELGNAYKVDFSKYAKPKPQRRITRLSDPKDPKPFFNLKFW